MALSKDEIDLLVTSNSRPAEPALSTSPAHSSAAVAGFPRLRTFGQD
jgi:hypothetical protein